MSQFYCATCCCMRGILSSKIACKLTSFTSNLSTFLLQVIFAEQLSARIRNIKHRKRKSLGLLDCMSTTVSPQQAERESKTYGAANASYPHPSERCKLLKKVKQLNVLESMLKPKEWEYREHVAELTRMTAEAKSDSQSKWDMIYLLDQVNYNHDLLAINCQWTYGLTLLPWLNNIHTFVACN